MISIKLRFFNSYGNNKLSAIRVKSVIIIDNTCYTGPKALQLARDVVNCVGDYF